jgi:diguanylate cyclase (GGDEF)-like protein/PAS domain S-box-containing protein
MEERRGSIRVGVGMTIVVAAGTVPYALATWDEPNRATILALITLGLVGALALPLLPLDRLLGGRLCEPFFLAWSVFDVAVISGLVAADGGTESPFTLLFALPFIFASLSYPMASFLAVSALTLIGFSIVAATAGGGPFSEDAYIAFGLTALAALSAWQVRELGVRRRRITEVTHALDRGITARRRAEDALRDAEERFRSAFESAPIGMALVALSPNSLGGIQQVNAAFAEITGREPAELVGSSLEQISHPEDTTREAELLDALLAGAARHHSIEARFLRPEGESVWASVSASIVRDADGEPLYAIVQLQDVSERKRFEDQLQYLADHDPLTGMLNRRRFEQELRKQVAIAERYDSGGAVLVIDLDNFKYMNDTLGHAIGDELITRVGAIVSGRLRETDTVARLGGDEFAVLLPETKPEEAVKAAEALREEIRSEPVVGGGRSMRLTASIGVSKFGFGSKAGSEAVLVNADIAMYESKAAGRDRVELLEAEGPKTKMRARLTWSERIREALEHDRFVLFQQPILDLHTDEVHRHELLLRMLDDTGDLIAPTSFLYIAEQFGLVQEIDRWVCSQALKLLDERARAGDGELTFEVNLSGISITDPAVTDFLEAAVRGSGVDATKLVFEVTETAAIANIDKARQFAARMAKLGCSFALDDFGAGFGSFYYLKHLPFDYLKIDGDFIRKLPVSKPDRLTVEAIVQIARGLGKRTIAEFVGDDATVEILRGYDVDFAQGYHVGRPAPISEAWEAEPQEV